MFRTITREELKQKMDKGEDFVLLDVRSLQDCKIEHIKGALCTPLEELESQIEKRHLDKKRETIVYCSSTQCNASPEAARKLEKFGFTKVEDYKAGIKEWEEAGYPVESEACGSC